jgi:hypothetical protein
VPADSKEKYTTIRQRPGLRDDRLRPPGSIKASDEILSDNGIRQRATDDLAAIWAKKK